MKQHSCEFDILEFNWRLFLVGVIGFLIIPFILFAQLTLPVDEGFEGSGTPSGWTDVGTSNYDYTTTVLTGTQSLFCSGSGVDHGAYAVTDTSDTVYARFSFRMSTLVASGTEYFFRIRNGTTTVCQIRYEQVGGDFLLYHGSVVSDALTFSPVAATKVYCWLDWIRGTGADGVAHVYMSTTNIQPESAAATITNGDATLTFNRVMVYADTRGVDWIFDDIYVDSTAVTAFPVDATETKKHGYDNYGGYGNYLR